MRGSNSNFMLRPLPLQRLAPVLAAAPNPIHDPEHSCHRHRPAKTHGQSSPDDQLLLGGVPSAGCESGGCHPMSRTAEDGDNARLLRRNRKSRLTSHSGRPATTFEGVRVSLTPVANRTLPIVRSQDSMLRATFRLTRTSMPVLGHKSLIQRPLQSIVSCGLMPVNPRHTNSLASSPQLVYRLRLVGIHFI